MEDLRRGQGGLAPPLHGARSALPEPRCERAPARAAKRGASAALASMALPANATEYRFEILGAQKARLWMGARASGRVRFGPIVVLSSRAAVPIVLCRDARVSHRLVCGLWCLGTKGYINTDATQKKSLSANSEHKLSLIQARTNSLNTALSFMRTTSVGGTIRIPCVTDNLCCVVTENLQLQSSSRLAQRICSWARSLDASRRLAQPAPESIACLL